MLLNTMIYMFLNIFSYNENTRPLFTGQNIVQGCLVILAVICIPWMLVPKPIIEKRRWQAKQAHKKAVGSSAHEEDGSSIKKKKKKKKNPQGFFFRKYFPFKKCGKIKSLWKKIKICAFQKKKKKKKKAQNLTNQQKKKKKNKKKNKKKKNEESGKNLIFSPNLQIMRAVVAVTVVTVTSLTSVKFSCTRLLRPSSSFSALSPTLLLISVCGPCLWPTPSSPRTLSKI